MDTNAAEAAGVELHVLRNKATVREMNDDARMLKSQNVQTWWSVQLEKWGRADKNVVLAELMLRPGYCDDLDNENLHRGGVVRLDRMVFIWEINWYLLPSETDGDWTGELADPSKDGAIWPELRIYSLEDYCRES
jgi:hypothetical protein